MPNVDRTVHKVELCVQCLGAPESWFSPSHPGGFPGIQVPEPDVLAACRAGVVGRSISVPVVGDEPSSAEKTAFHQACRAQIGAHFEHALAGAGPGAHRWVLGQQAVGTIRDRIIWIFGTQAVAMTLSVQKKAGDGSPDPGAPIEPYLRTYDVPTTDGQHARVVARFQLLFHLVPE
jgi:hypothetical protein